MNVGNGHATSAALSTARRGAVPGTDSRAVTSAATIQYVDPVTLKNDPELDRLWPLEDLHGPSELAFVDDVGERGVQDPLKVSPDGRFVWDGRRRLRAAKRFPDRVKTVPVMRCREEDRSWVILFGITHRRNMSPSAQLYIGYPWWSQVLEAAKQNRVKNLRKGLSTPISQIDEIGNLTLGKLAEKLGIQQNEFTRCQEVLKLFEEHPEARAQWEPKILSGKASFWNVLSGRAGEESTRQNAGLTPAEFRHRSAKQCYMAIKTWLVRWKDFESLSKKDERDEEEWLQRTVLVGKRALTPEQLRAAGDAMERRVKLVRRLEAQAQELRETENEAKEAQ
jgi:hypothetical protein